MTIDMNWNTCKGCGKPFDIKEKDKMVASVNNPTERKITGVYHSKECVKIREYLIDLNSALERDFSDN